MAEPHRTRVFQTLAQVVKIISERYVRSTIATENVTFVRLGLTDSIIMTIAAGEILVLTDDFKLSQHLGYAGLAVLNFNHLRRLV
jgi:hypothetical protein